MPTPFSEFPLKPQQNIKTFRYQALHITFPKETDIIVFILYVFLIGLDFLNLSMRTLQK